MAATIYKMSPVPEIGQSIDSLDSTSHGQLEVLASLEFRDDLEVTKLLWQPNDGNKVVTVNSDSRINVWDFSSEGRVQVLFVLQCFLSLIHAWCGFQNEVHSEPLVKTHNQVTAANWSPHHGTNQVAVAMETNLQVIDLRSINKGSIYNIENAHQEPIRDLDFNPNRQYYMATCGDDGCTKFWDVRNISSPVLNRHDHYHWYAAFQPLPGLESEGERVAKWCFLFYDRVWAVRYNVFHDQLVLTAGSDARVVLTSAASLSSEPFGKLMSDEKDNDEGDFLLYSYTQDILFHTQITYRWWRSESSGGRRYHRVRRARRLGLFDRLVECRFVDVRLPLVRWPATDSPRSTLFKTQHPILNAT